MMIYLYIALGVILGFVFMVGSMKAEMAKFDSITEAHRLWAKSESEEK